MDINYSPLISDCLCIVMNPIFLPNSVQTLFKSTNNHREDIYVEKVKNYFQIGLKFIQKEDTLIKSNINSNNCYFLDLYILYSYSKRCTQTYFVLCCCLDVVNIFQGISIIFYIGKCLYESGI